MVTPSTGLMKVGARAMLLFGVLLALVLRINELNVLNNYVGRDFMTALEAGDVWSVRREQPHDYRMTKSNYGAPGRRARRLRISGSSSRAGSPAHCAGRAAKRAR
jgi:hypothetical protein